MTTAEYPLFSVFQIGVSIHNLNKKSEKSTGLSLVQWCLLKQLIDLPAAPAQLLAKAVGVHPSTLTQTLKRLERKQLIFITVDPNDSRRKLISITRAGKGALDTASLKLKRWQKDLSEFGHELKSVSSFLRDKVG